MINEKYKNTIKALTCSCGTITEYYVYSKTKLYCVCTKLLVRPHGSKCKVKT